LGKSDFIVDGGTVSDIAVIKTDNEKLAEIIRQADEFHNTKFQAAAAEMMQNNKQLGPEW